eukprot:10108611-Alexandrium_andersonii.AAC.1
MAGTCTPLEPHERPAARALGTGRRRRRREQPKPNPPRNPPPGAKRQKATAGLRNVRTRA